MRLTPLDSPPARAAAGRSTTTPSSRRSPSSLFQTNKKKMFLTSGGAALLLALTATGPPAADAQEGWGAACIADLNTDAIVGVDDLLMLLAQYGRECIAVEGTPEQCTDEQTAASNAAALTSYCRANGGPRNTVTNLCTAATTNTDATADLCAYVRQASTLNRITCGPLRPDKCVLAVCRSTNQARRACLSRCLPCLSAYLNAQRLHGYDGHIRWGRAVNHRPDLVSRDGIAGSPSSAASAGRP
jgi:hypothetical protein